MAVSMILMTAMLFAVSVCAARFLSHFSGSMAPIRICVAGISEGSRVNEIINILGRMDSIRDICYFDTVDSKEDALSAIDKGSADAAVILPENFYHDIMTGINTPAEVYAPEEGIMSTDLFREMVRDGVSLIRSSESGIYAATAQSQTVPVTMGSIHDMDVLLTDLYIRACLNRMNVYTEETYSAIGNLTLPEYYCAAGLTLILFGMGLNFRFLFTEESFEMEKKLRVYGVPSFADCAVKTIVIAGAMWLVLALLLCADFGLSAAGVLAGKLGEFSFAASLPRTLLRMVPAVLMAASFDVLIYTLIRRSSQSSMIFLYLGLFMIFSCGCILPSVFLPNAVQTIGAVLPLSIWRQYCGQALFSQQFSWVGQAFSHLGNSSNGQALLSQGISWVSPVLLLAAAFLMTGISAALEHFSFNRMEG